MNALVIGNFHLPRCISMLIYFCMCVCVLALYLLCVCVCFVGDCEDPLQGDFPEVIEEYLEYGVMKCIAFNRRGTLLAGNDSVFVSRLF